MPTQPHLAAVKQRMVYTTALDCNTHRPSPCYPTATVHQACKEILLPWTAIHTTPLPAIPRPLYTRHARKYYCPGLQYTPPLSLLSHGHCTPGMQGNTTALDCNTHHPSPCYPTATVHQACKEILLPWTAIHTTPLPAIPRPLYTRHARKYYYPGLQYRPPLSLLSHGHCTPGMQGNTTTLDCNTHHPSPCYPTSTRHARKYYYIVPQLKTLILKFQKRN